jgi:hypothetical protein
LNMPVGANIVKRAENEGMLPPLTRILDRTSGALDNNLFLKALLLGGMGTTGAVMGAPVGAAIGTPMGFGAGIARKRPGAGAVRGLVRGGLTGAGAGAGMLMGGTAAGLMGGSPTAQALAQLAGGAAGGLGGWATGGALMGPPGDDRKKQAAEKVALVVNQRRPMALRPVSSTVGRLAAPVHAYVSGSSAPFKPGPRRQDIEPLVDALAGDLDVGEDELAIHAGGGRPLENLRRVWQREQLSLPSKLLGTLGSPVTDAAAAMLRQDHYNPWAHSITAYQNDPAMVADLMGRAADSASSKNPGLYAVARGLPLTSLVASPMHNIRGGDRALAALKKHYQETMAPEAADAAYGRDATKIHGRRAGNIAMTAADNLIRVVPTLPMIAGATGGMMAAPAAGRSLGRSLTKLELEDDKEKKTKAEKKPKEDEKKQEKQSFFKQAQQPGSYGLRMLNTPPEPQPDNDYFDKAYPAMPLPAFHPKSWGGTMPNKRPSLPPNQPDDKALSIRKPPSFLFGGVPDRPLPSADGARRLAQPAVPDRPLPSADGARRLAQPQPPAVPAGQRQLPQAAVLNKQGASHPCGDLLPFGGSYSQDGFASPMLAAAILANQRRGT